MYRELSVSFSFGFQLFDPTGFLFVLMFMFLF